MLLEFIGEDRSMNLERGKDYEVDIRSDHRFIYVRWFGEDGKVLCCPYSSPALFACNWTTPSVKEYWRKANAVY